MKRGSIKEPLPSGDIVLVEPMVVDDANQMFSTDIPSEQYYKLLENGVYLDPDVNKKNYDWKQQWDANNFSCLMLKRRATFGDEFRFQVECSRCDYGRQKNQIGFLWKKYHTVWLGSQIKKDDVWIDNPQKIKMIKWEEEQNKLTNDGKQNFGVDKNSGRFLVYLQDEQSTLVLRLLVGDDAKEIQKIASYPENKTKKISKMLHLRTIGILGEEKADVSDWRKALYDKPDEEFLEQISYGDFEDIIAAQQAVDGGIETDFEESCPVCGSSLVATSTEPKSKTIPFLSKDFFSKASRLR